MDSKIILRIKSELEGLLKIILAHKVISVVAAAVILSVFYYAYNNAVAVSNSAPRYVLTAVQQGTFIASIAGTGQVSASIQLNIQPQVSGTITSIDVTQGQKASAGDVLVRLDPTTAEKTVRNAQISLQSAKLSLQQLEEAPTQLSITQDQNAITQAEASQQTAQANLSEDYENAFNNISGAFVNMPGIISGLNNILFGMSVNPSQTNADAYNSLIAPDAPDSIQFERTAVATFVSKSPYPRQGSISDLSVGQNVVISGTTNPDGSLTAEDVRVRPAGTSTPFVRYQQSQSRSSQSQ